MLNRLHKAYWFGFKGIVSQSLKHIFCILLSGFSVNLFAQEVLTLITENGPPHMIQASNSGIDIDITTQILKRMGYETNFVYAPLRRAKVQVQLGEADLTVPTFQTKDTDGFYISQPIIDYRPTVFSIQAFDFENINNIEKLRVRSFQGATGYFGQSFIEMTQQNDYLEIANMETLVMMLVTGRVDIVVLDYYIFYYYLRNLPIEKPNITINEHQLIPAVKASVGFNSAKIRDAFNQAYQVFEQQRSVQSIVDSYIGSRHSSR